MNTYIRVYNTSTILFVFIFEILYFLLNNYKWLLTYFFIVSVHGLYRRLKDTLVSLVVGLSNIFVTHIYCRIRVLKRIDG
jgi:hypothetical protein